MKYTLILLVNFVLFLLVLPVLVTIVIFQFIGRAFKKGSRNDHTYNTDIY